MIQSKAVMLRGLMRLSSSSNMFSRSLSSSTAGTVLPDKIIVFGGSGYVGSAVCKALVNLNCKVESISRGGSPSSSAIKNDPSLERVTWSQGDVFDPSQYEHKLDDNVSVVSCVGAFAPSNDAMFKINGTANVQLAELAAFKSVPRFTFVSATKSNLPEFVLKGYFEGKLAAERAVLQFFPDGSGTVLRPSGVSGTRAVSDSVSLPLWALMDPLEKVFSLPPFKAARQQIPGMKAVLAPPIKLDHVGKATALAAIGALSQEGGGIVEVEEMNRLAEEEYHKYT